ncbi:MAG: hypothetical protein PWQ83_1063 [Thermosipho sp. (in: thermotogales)]|nr:hypothetical protein [Thermosipho sp. (in: thermotogales)]
MNITNVSISEGQVVDLNGSIQIIFDDIINESTFNNNTVYLLDEFGNRVDINLEIVDVQTVLVNYNNLKSTTQYTLYILNNTITQDGVQSILGETLISDYTLTFVTRNVIETDTIIDYTDQNIEGIDISDKPIKLYNQGNAVYWEYNPIKFDGVLT